MQKSYILAIDQGTTSTRSIIFDNLGRVCGIGQLGHKQIYDKPGWVSHSGAEIFDNVLKTSSMALETSGLNVSDIVSIGITNQRETVVLWDKNTGEAVCDAIVWQDLRTAEICAQMEADGMGAIVRDKTGLLIDPYFSGAKIKWALDNVPNCRALMDNGSLLAGTIDTYLVWQLTARKTHATDYTNASRTMLFNINKLDWDEELLRYFGINKNILPNVVTSSGICADTCENVFGAAIPISGIAGDQHASLFGQMCYDKGDAKNTYGTGCFVLMNIGSKPLITDSKLLTTMAWHINGEATYALEGSIFNAGSAVEWLINGAGLAGSVDEINKILNNTPNTGGVYFVPALSGLGAPYWDMGARGTICGLNLSTGKDHIIRALMESIAFHSRDVIDHMNEVSKIPLKTLKADGGVSKSDFVMQFQSNLLGVEVVRPKITETTARGVFFLAGLGCGLFGDISEVVKLRGEADIFTPIANTSEMDNSYIMWKKAVKRSKGWV